MPSDRDDPRGVSAAPPSESGMSDDVPPVTDGALLRWARGFIEALARGEHADLHSLDDPEEYPFERHVALAQVVPEMLRTRRAPVQRAAAWVAGAADVHDERTVPLLVRLLRDRAPLTRMAGAWACKEIGEDAATAVPALVAALKDPDGGVRLAAVCALRGIGVAAAAVPALLDIANSASAGDLRSEAVKALADIAPDDLAVREIVLRALESADRVEQFAGAYGVALTTSAPAGALPRLTANLASADPYLVTVTAWAVGKLADTRGQTPAPAPALLDALKRMHWMRIEHKELEPDEPDGEFVSIRPVLGEALEPHLPASADPDPQFEDFRLTFFLHVFRPAPAGDTRWVDEIVTHPWYLKIQRARFGHPAGAAERAAVREMVQEAQAKFAARLLKNPTLGVAPADYVALPGFIKNHCRNIAWRLRHRRRKGWAGRVDLDVSGAADPRAAEAGAEVLEIIETFLPAEEREAARLVFVLGYSIAEAAAALSLTASQVKTRLGHAKRRLAARLR
jgi:hypothetical protein